MESKIITKALMLSILSIIGLTFAQCSKSDSTTANSIKVVPGNLDTGKIAVDTSWTLDEVHCGFTWKTEFMDLSGTYLTGRFNNWGFSPKFSFDQTNPGNGSIHIWIDLSTFNTGQPGRDGNGKCGRSYLGVTYLDSAKTKIDSSSIWCYFDATTITRSGSGYVAQGTLRLNRYRAPSGYADGTYISKPMTLYFTVNEMADFDTNGDGVTDQFRAGLSGHLAFNRRDFVDPNSTKQWVPTPKVGTTNLSSGDIAGNVIAANNTTYGVYMTEVSDSMYVEVDPVFYKNH